MADANTPLTTMAKRVNNALLAPLVVGPNLGLAAINAMVGGTARVSAASAKVAEEARFPLAGAVRAFSDKVAHSTLSTANESLEAASAAVQNVADGRERSNKGSNRLLAQTFLNQGLRTGALPISVTVDSATAAVEGPLRKQAEEAWLVINRWLDDLSIHGVVPGRLGTKTNSNVRFGFYYMAAWGPSQAILRDIKGVVGGFLALPLGDFERLGEALPHYWESMEYVYDKKLHDEVEPESDFPIGATLAADAEATILRFPWNFTRALQSGKATEVLRSAIKDFGLITTLVTRFPRVEFNVVYDVVVFIQKALLEAGDAQNYALCELGIMESSLSDEEKDWSLTMLRKTANNNTIEYEYYVPLLVPQDGTPIDRAHRQDAGGEPIVDTAISNSVFKQSAIDRAQAINSELFSLRAFLWLYGDEEVARQKNREQTVMKFGTHAADRIEQSPVYPLAPQELAALVQDGPRAPQEINQVFFHQLRKRGLEAVSDMVATHLPGGLPGDVTHPAEELPETPGPPI